eukprot:scaffold189563_cov31-Tisochrysis_lutea.AAC.3
MATRFRLMYLCNTVRSPLVRVGEWTAAECGKYESFEREPGGRAIAHLSVARAAATPSVAERRPKPCTSVGDTRWKYVVCRLAANSLRAAGLSRVEQRLGLIATSEHGTREGIKCEHGVARIICRQHDERRLGATAVNECGADGRRWCA